LYAPQNTDVVYSNNFTVTLDANYITPTGLTVTNASITGTTFRDGGTSATAGGSFTLGNNCVLNANVSAFSAICVNGSINSPNTATINGTITGGNGSGGSAIGFSVSSGNGTYYINGDIVGGSGTGANQYGVSFSNAGSLIVVGNIKNNTTSSSNYNYGLTISGSLSLSVTITGTVSSISTNSVGNNTPLTISNPLANVTVNGNVTSAGAANSITITSVGVLTINGSVTGGSSYGVQSGTGTVNIYGDIIPGTGNSGFGVWVGGSGTVNITGNVVGGALSTSSAAINNNASGPVNIYGTLEGGANQSGYSTSGGSNGTLTATRMKGNGYGVGSTGIAQTYAAYNFTNTLFYARELEFGPLGMAPVYGAVKLVPLSSNVCVVRLTTGAAKTLVDASSSLDFPVTSNVRSGVSYNAGNLVGTCAVPSASSVVSGVAVDATVGTASLSPASVWNYSLSSVASNSVGEKLKKTANTSDIIALG
jgi:hypothetical protein